MTISVGATLALPGESAEDLDDRHMYASTRNGRNVVTGDAGPLTRRADRPILGTGIPWEMAELHDFDGFGSGEST